MGGFPVAERPPRDALTVFAGQQSVRFAIASPAMDQPAVPRFIDYIAKMRLTAAFFANRAEVVNGLLNVDGGFWNSTTVGPDAVGFQTYTVVLCDVDPEDVGQPFSLIIDGQGPSGQRWTPAHASNFTLDSTILFLYMPMMALPVEPGGGLHHYTFRLDGQHERVDVSLTVHVASP